MVTCVWGLMLEEVVQLLLEAGANPAFAEDKGFISLDVVAGRGHIDVFDMLCSRAPDTLDRCHSERGIPLYMACAGSHEGVVSWLLSLGAMHQMCAINDCSMSPLSTAVHKGFVGVFINEGGKKAVRRETALAQALYLALPGRQLRILRLLLMVGGEDKRSRWANIWFEGMSLLHFGAALGQLAVVSVLL